jgi:DNA-binding NarL/FixJ family response regulator
METIRVVLVDDHALLREGTRKLLEGEPDFKVVGEAANGLDGVKVVRAEKPDVVLMDVVMPGLAGLEATRQIKQSNPAVAIIILSAYDDDRYVLSLLEAGIAGYLLKSAGGHELIQAIRAIKAGEAVLHPRVTAKLLARASRSSTHASSSSGGDRPSERELEVLRLAANGMGNKEIAAELALSVATVKAHLVNVFNKMGVGSRTEAVLQGLRYGWIRMEDMAYEAPAPNGAEIEHAPEPPFAADGGERHLRASV